MDCKSERHQHNFHCRFCRYYQLLGRRGGHCELLNVPADGNWEACPFAARPFPEVQEKQSLESKKPNIKLKKSPTVKFAFVKQLISANLLFDCPRKKK